MRRRRILDHRGEILDGMVVIGIIAISAVMIFPLYVRYVERKRVTEAISIMGVIITSQKVEKQRTDKYYSASTVAEFKSRGIRITDTKFFTYETVTTPNGGYKVTATSTDAFGAGGGLVTFTYDPTANPPGRWGDEDLILKDWFANPDLRNAALTIYVIKTSIL